MNIKGNLDQFQIAISIQESFKADGLGLLADKYFNENIDFSIEFALGKPQSYLN